VSWFLASNTVIPSRNGAVTVVSNQDCVSVITPLSQQIADLALGSATAAAGKTTAEVQTILQGLRQGRIDRSLFTDNANSYFSDLALRDAKASLGRLGPLQSVTAGTESQRGGMTHRSYRAQFQKKALNVSVYVTSAGKYEQLLLTE
jgi:hypothetical protein